MKTNVTYQKQDYYVNPEKRVCACKLQCTVNLSKLNIWYLLENDEDFIDWFMQKYDLRYDTSKGIAYVSFNVSGKSKASGADEFNETVGKRVSLTRAQGEAFAYACKIYDDIVNYLDDTFISQIDSLADNCVIALSNAEEHTDFLLKPYE